MAVEKIPLDPNPDQLDTGEPFSHWLQLLRGSVRPLVILVLVAVLAWAFVFIVMAKELSTEIMTGIVVGVTGMAGTVVGVWFGQRK